MTALARGRCPKCGQDVALRKGDLLREHRAWPNGKAPKGYSLTFGLSSAPICRESGKPAAKRGARR